jgi:thioredoxin 1
MNSLILGNDNRDQLAAALTDDRWVVACLCAAWCGTCNDYQAGFTAWAEQRPDIRFVWIDIEDQADVVGDLDIVNFPTLLIQRGDIVAFFGTVLPDLRLADRLLLAQVEKSDAMLRNEAFSSTERKTWQKESNLRSLLHDASAS